MQSLTLKTLWVVIKNFPPEKVFECIPPLLIRGILETELTPEEREAFYNVYEQPYSDEDYYEFMNSHVILKSLHPFWLDESIDYVYPEVENIDIWGFNKDCLEKYLNIFKNSQYLNTLDTSAWFKGNQDSLIKLLAVIPGKILSFRSTENDLNDDFVKFLCDCDVFSQLKILDLERNRVSLKGVKSICSSKFSHTLEEIVLDYNFINKECFECILENIDTNLRKLKVFSMKYCTTPECSACEYYTEFKNHPKMKHIKFV